MASLIKTLSLERNRITLLLVNHLDVEGDSVDSEAAPSQPMEVCLVMEISVECCAN